MDKHFTTSQYRPTTTSPSQNLLRTPDSQQSTSSDGSTKGFCKESDASPSYKSPTTIDSCSPSSITVSPSLAQRPRRTFSKTTPILKTPSPQATVKFPTSSVHVLWSPGSTFWDSSPLSDTFLHDNHFQNRSRQSATTIYTSSSPILQESTSSQNIDISSPTFISSSPAGGSSYSKREMRTEETSPSYQYRSVTPIQNDFWPVHQFQSPFFGVHAQSPPPYRADKEPALLESQSPPYRLRTPPLRLSGATSIDSEPWSPTPTFNDGNAPLIWSSEVDIQIIHTSPACTANQIYPCDFTVGVPVPIPVPPPHYDVPERDSLSPHYHYWEQQQRECDRERGMIYDTEVTVDVLSDTSYEGILCDYGADHEDCRGGSDAGDEGSVLTG